MRHSFPEKCLMALFSMLIVFSVFIDHHVISANPEKPVNPELNLPQTGPGPEAKWSIAESDVDSDWKTYAAVDYISDLVVSGDTIWATSDGGLLEWDRTTGSVAQYLNPAFPLPGNYLSRVILKDNVLYISGSNGVALFDLDEGSWILYESEDIGLETDFGVELALSDGVLWVGANNAIGQLFPDGHWELVYPGRTTYPDYDISNIIAQDDKVYVVVRQGSGYEAIYETYRYFDQQWEKVDQPEIFYSEAPDGGLWKTEDYTVFYSSDAGMTWQQIMEYDNRPKVRYIDPEGIVYITEDDAIHVFQEKQDVQTLRYSELGPELNYINILEFDQDGRLWIATDGRGLTMYDGETWVNWQDGMNGMRDDCIRGMALGNDKVYAGTHSSSGSGGVNILDIETEQWTNFWPDESELSGGGVDGIAIDSEGRVYFPTSASVLDIYDNNEQWQHVAMPSTEYMTLSTSEGLFDDDGHYWVGTHGLGLGLWEYDGEQWLVYNIRSSINGIAYDDYGYMWVATSDGLWVRNLDGDWWLYTAEEFSFDESWCKDVVSDTYGRVWVINPNNLFVFNGSTIYEFPSNDIGSRNWGDTVTMDLEGNIWVETWEGMAKYSGEVPLDAFSSLELEPAQIISESEMLVDITQENWGRYPDTFSPAIPVRPVNTALIISVVALMGCGLILTIIACVVIFFIIRRKLKAKDAVESEKVMEEIAD